MRFELRGTHLGATWLRREVAPEVAGAHGRGRVFSIVEPAPEERGLLGVAGCAERPEVVEGAAAAALGDGEDVVGGPVVALEARVEAAVFLAAGREARGPEEDLEALGGRERLDAAEEAWVDTRGGSLSLHPFLACF